MKTVNKTVVIGSSTNIQLPEADIANVPAKVDTGADSSSIWASNIRENKGWLYFTLFGESSPLYTGEVLKTRDYQVRSIKNSFGQSEFRYKVQLPAVIEGRKISVRFTLANRSANYYPALIGRRTLHGRFIVDVTRSHGRKVHNVLVLDVKKIGSVENFFKKLGDETKRYKFTHATIDNLKFAIDSSGVSVGIGSDDAASFDFVYFKSVMDNRDPAIALAQYLEKRGIPFVDRAILHYPLNNKLAQYVLLSDAGIRVPKSLYMSPRNMRKSYGQLVDFLGLPFVLKDIHGSKGRNNFLIKDDADFKAVYKDKKSSKLLLVAQQFIANEGDYRVLVFGKRVSLVIHRKSHKSHLNNVSAGGKATISDETVLPGSVRRKSVLAAGLMHLDVAGVDFMQDKQSGLWYVLEVQHGPQLTSGSYVTEKRAEFLKFMDKKLR